tara:strand:- start:1514 stop:2695 length:1182 start_codon:yes stop_codon:yes gene_type:complete
MLELIGRNKELFETDIKKFNSDLENIISKSKFLVLGGAGTIGQATTKEIFKRNPKKLHVVDISENNLVELVRDIRSSFGYISGDFKTFALDIGSIEYDFFIETDGKYDYVLNLSALKHVRSEKDPYTLMRMIDVNIFNTVKTIEQSIVKGVKKYFCVSTDKAANPVNMMGASKRIMEKFLMQKSNDICISTARFANVAYSDGSLLHGFNQRMRKNQPIVAPYDVKRYFVTPEESGQLCLMSVIYGKNRDIYFPKLNENLHLISFSEIAKKHLSKKGYQAIECKTEEEARELCRKKELTTQWPCFFSKSDTTGEKDFEEFFTENEILDMITYDNFGVIKNDYVKDEDSIKLFWNEISKMKQEKNWSKKEIIKLFHSVIPEFNYLDKGKYLDSKM